ncbi:MAG: hypothetical protein DHS20C05_03560 [Hyphococcus sp.]|nr:MAG: hypothetical protein DHS20C05_03560 [Marinicaulis sp.]
MKRNDPYTNLLNDPDSPLFGLMDRSAIADFYGLSIKSVDKYRRHPKAPKPKFYLGKKPLYSKAQVVTILNLNLVSSESDAMGGVL